MMGDEDLLDVVYQEFTYNKGARNLDLQNLTRLGRGRKDGNRIQARERDAACEASGYSALSA